MAVAIQAIRRLESKIEDLTAAIKAPKVQPQDTSKRLIEDQSHQQASSPFQPGGPSPFVHMDDTQNDESNVHASAMSPQVFSTLSSRRYLVPESHGIVALSFSQHRIAIWPAIKDILPCDFNSARAKLPQDYIGEIESQRAPLHMCINPPDDSVSDSWLMSLSRPVVEGLSNAYFTVFHRNMPILDRAFYYSSTLSLALEKEFAYDMESCLVLNVLALGCLAVKAHEEGDFALPSELSKSGHGFARPEWYKLTEDDMPGLSFFNEARKRFGFLICQNDLQAGQFYMLSTLYYAQILRPFDSWAMVNRAALCCTSLLTRTDTTDFDQWEGDMLSRLFWNTLMYETVITQELDLLPHSGLLEYEPTTPLPKFTPYPWPKMSISGLLADDEDSFFNFHFLAQAAHRRILTRVKESLYYFAEKEDFPSANLTAEMHHQLEQWRLSLPSSLQFSDDEAADDSTSPAHVIAKAMLRSRYLVAKSHIGRPFVYKALHASAYTSDTEYNEVRDSLRGGMYWPATMGLCTQIFSCLPLKFGWCCQCFGQILLLHAVARSPDEKLRSTLPDDWKQWVENMMTLIERCARDSPGIAKDYELLRLL